MLQGLVSYYCLSHQYGKPVTINYLMLVQPKIYSNIVGRGNYIAKIV